MLKLKRITAVLLCALAVLCALSSCGFDPQKELDRVCCSSAFSGVVRAVRDGEVLCEYAEGTENYSSDKRITADSRFCVGSVSKQIAAACAMLLKERGALRVEDTLDKYYPDCVYGDRVTVRQLLTQRSGIAEFYRVEDSGGCYNEIPTGELEGVVTNENTVEENRRLLTDWIISQPLIFEPGSYYMYTNSNYFLLTGIIAQLAETSYEDFARENIFKPLGMNDTCFIDDDSSGFNLAQSPRAAKTVYVGITRGLGDIVSNARDMERWLDSLADNSVLKPESVSEMTANYCSKADGTLYGYGIKPDNRGGLFHTGFFTTYCALVYTVPEKRFTFFAATNDCKTVRGGMLEMFREIIKESAYS